jgi:hypothetical protein
MATWSRSGRRAGIAIALGGLRKARLIHHTRGRLTVCDRPGLAMVACECRAAARQAFECSAQRLAARIIYPALG